MREKAAPEPLLTAGQVAVFFGVDARTITKWARTGKFPALKTLGGHRRFDPADVRRLLAAARSGGDSA
jgi:excisionase family DNA binding protein